jgi:hypothetical protein
MSKRTRRDKALARQVKEWTGTLAAIHSHSAAVPIIVQPLIVTAGSSMSHAPIQAARLVMAGNPRPIIEGLPGYVPIIVKLDWPDMNTPDMSVADWRWLADRLRGLKRPLHVSCAMGHGRTGSALAILCHMWGAIPAGTDAVQWVRDRYCPDAIETEVQIRYVERMTGRPSQCKPSHKDYTFPAGGGYGEWTSKSGWSPSGSQRTYESTLPGGSALDDVGQTSEGHVFRPQTRWCASRTPSGGLCPKPARVDGTLCDLHFYESLPGPGKIDAKGDL